MLKATMQKERTFIEPSGIMIMTISQISFYLIEFVEQYVIDWQMIIESIRITESPVPSIPLEPEVDLGFRGHPNMIAQ